MSKPTRLAVCATAVFIVSTVRAQAQTVLTRHVRPAISGGQARYLEPMPATQFLRLDVVLPLRDQAGLDQLLREISDPSSPNYRHFLSPAEFTDDFGPSEEQYDTLTRYVISHGFRVAGGSREGTDLQIEGPVSAIETAFHVQMGVYQHPTEDRTFYSPDREPTVDLPFPLWHISGLDNYSIPRPRLARKSDYARAHNMKPEEVVAHATTGSGPANSFLGSDMRAAYYGGSLTGAGQYLGLLEFAGTDLADLKTYYSNAGQPYTTVPITLLSTDGTSTSCVYSTGGHGHNAQGCDDTEQTIDMTMALGVAPGLAGLRLYIGSTDTAILSSMTTQQPLAISISCSWGWTPADPNTDNPYWERMAAQGQNFFTASGDYYTWTKTGDAEAWPADAAYVVGVGGTDLTTASAGGPWKSETAWDGSGGGPSPDGIAIPSWQKLTGVINSSNKGSTTLRNGPDVAANANYTYYVCADQSACTANEYGGTSFAAPIWAGYMALVNEQAANNGNGLVGFVNPYIYPIGVGSTYSSNFHDITSGSSGKYSAVAGYDLVTGWGSPNGSGLINSLSGY
jgi:subtilase family serine protease